MAKAKSAKSRVKSLTCIAVVLGIVFFQYTLLQRHKEAATTSQTKISDVHAENDENLAKDEVPRLYSKVTEIKGNIKAHTKLLTAPDKSSLSFQDKPKTKQSQYKEQKHAHIIFSTDCGGFQNWQSELLYYSAKRVGHEGGLTRIASGCKEEEGAFLIERYQKYYPSLDIHLTPDFSHDPKTGRVYKFYNKPYGLVHWLEHGSHSTITGDGPIQDGTIIALVDPDFVFLKPLWVNLTDSSQLIGTGPVHIGPYGTSTVYGGKPNDLTFDRVSHGHPVGQTYGLGAGWITGRWANRSYVCGEGSPCLRTTVAEAIKQYPVGPPYIATAKDLKKIGKTWCQFVPKMFDINPTLLAEMYAFCAAAAHEDLPHLRLDSYMVSNVYAGGEGWKFIDNLQENVCDPGIIDVGKRTLLLPSFVHFCQTYRVGKFLFHKRKVPHTIFSCEEPMLADPPRDLSQVLHHYRNPRERIDLTPKQSKRTAFMVCYIVHMLNEALADFKRKSCPRNVDTGQVQANFDRTGLLERKAKR